jgi:DNA-binding MarR family transcriptional regulator
LSTIKITFAQIYTKPMEHKENNPLALTLGGMLREVARILRKRTDEQMETKLTMEQIGLLIAIHNSKDEVIQQDMACSLGKDKSAILRTIDLVEAKELIKRVSDTTDRRKKYLMVTKKGEKVIEQFLQIDLELTAELENGISEQDLNSFYKVVSLIKSNAKEL